ncbi:hypothetical protein ACFZC6_24470 [Streptomyces ossamyceticus]
MRELPTRLMAASPEFTDLWAGGGVSAGTGGAAATYARILTSSSA